MGATDFEPRRFITRHDVDDAAAAGGPLRVGARDVLTDEAAERGRELGVRVEKGTPATASSSAGVESDRGADSALRRAVRAAVIAELGAEPAALDEVIDRVLRRRS